MGRKTRQREIELAKKDDTIVSAFRRKTNHKVRPSTRDYYTAQMNRLKPYQVRKISPKTSQRSFMVMMLRSMS